MGVQGRHESSGAPPPSFGSPLAATTLGGNLRVYYRDGDGHVHELAFWLPNWVHRDVTHDAVGGAMPGYGGSPLAATTLNGNPRVYYQGNNYARIHELAWIPNDWHDRDIGSGAVPIDGAEWGAIPGTGLAATTLNGNPRVYYVEPGYKVHELAWIPSVWNHRNLTKDAKGPPAPPVWWKDWAGLAATMLDGNPRVYYQGEDCAYPRAGIAPPLRWGRRVAPPGGVERCEGPAGPTR